ncbi:MAG: peptide chain release factor N(5)-glutamine methyltransferase [Candidatus Hydrogenedentes bacterium]|nr:peptide chain release factor N(5)-glutamine methyltransferase [Candidatus Hydrogenedentota bacterium]
MSTAAETLAKAASLLELVSETPRLDAEYLLAHAMGCTRSALLRRLHEELPQNKAFEDYFARRLNREPVAYILGEWEFYSLELAVPRPLLVPRPETEHLVEVALKHLQPGAHILDLCCGTGCVGIAILANAPKAFVASEPTSPLVPLRRGIKGDVGIDCKSKHDTDDMPVNVEYGPDPSAFPRGTVGTSETDQTPGSRLRTPDSSSSSPLIPQNSYLTSSDILPLAIATTEANAARHHLPVTTRLGNLFHALQPGDGPFHIIVSNPPYVEAAAWEGLAPDITRYEDRNALIAGEDGLDIIRRIIAQAPAHLHPGGLLALEMGEAHWPAVLALFQTAGYTDIGVKKDLAGIDRIAHAVWPD